MDNQILKTLQDIQNTIKEMREKMVTKDELKAVHKSLQKSIDKVDQTAMDILELDKHKADKTDVKNLERRVDKIERLVNAS